MGLGRINRCILRNAMIPSRYAADATQGHRRRWPRSSPRSGVRWGRPSSRSSPGRGGRRWSPRPTPISSR
eukprot:11197934-Lingulodinium_polyedra.AAC.1